MRTHRREGELGNGALYTAQALEANSIQHSSMILFLRLKIAQWFNVCYDTGVSVVSALLLVGFYSNTILIITCFIPLVSGFLVSLHICDALILNIVSIKIFSKVTYTNHVLAFSFSDITIETAVTYFSTPCSFWSHRRRQPFELLLQPVHFPTGKCLTIFSHLSFHLV